MSNFFTKVNCRHLRTSLESIIANIFDTIRKNNDFYIFAELKSILSYDRNFLPY